MAKIYIVARSDGVVTLLSCADGADPAKEMIKRGQNVISIRLALPPDLEFAQDRSYRDAWVIRGSRIDHDMDKAREIHKEFIRAARKPLLDESDVEYQLADETGNVPQKTRIIAKKKMLRDLTDDIAISSAKNVDELRATWPDLLGANPFTKK